MFNKVMSAGPVLVLVFMYDVNLVYIHVQMKHQFITRQRIIVVSDVSHMDDQL